MQKYIDGFVLPISKAHLAEYERAASKIAEVWKDYGALEYYECTGDELYLEGVRSFMEVLDVKEDEVVVFGWVVFPSKEVRDQANEKVPNDPRMSELVAPLIKPERLIFNAGRMVYGGFKTLVHA